METFAGSACHPSATRDFPTHRATLQDGTDVVVKIRRPGIRKAMQADLRLITHLAGIVEASSMEARRFQPQALVGQLLDTVLEELDFTNEDRNADRLRADLADNPAIVIPAIHWRYSSESVLVMDYIAGLPPRDGDSLRAAGIDPAAIADLGAALVLDMVLVNGRFHGDPHPGNLLCLPGDRLALLDLGLSRAKLVEGLAPLGLDFKLVVKKVQRNGFASRYVDVRVPVSAKKKRAEEKAHAHGPAAHSHSRHHHGHSHGHGQSHEPPFVATGATRHEARGTGPSSPGWPSRAASKLFAYLCAALRICVRPQS